LRRLGIIVHGEPGTGKSWVGATAPAYRLVLDAEGGSTFAPGVKTYWRADVEPPPEPGVGRPEPTAELQELTWETCIVELQDFSTMQKVYDWLNTGRHPFRSVVVDSITELQKRIVDQTSGVNQPTQQDWGAILRVCEDLVRKMRDLLRHPTRPLECVMFIALSHHRDGKYRPFVKGQLELTLPGFIDVVGYLYVEANADGQLVRKLLIAPLGEIDAKDRTNALTVAYGPIIEGPHLETMLQVIDAATS
jgi:hypothetical protein